jgi:hypothetical protein
MSDQRRVIFRRNSSQLRENAKKTAKNYVPGGSLLVHMSDHASSSRTQPPPAQQQQQPKQGVSSARLPDEKTTLLVTDTRTPPPVEVSEAPIAITCCCCCFGLILVLAGLVLGILIIYLHYLYGFMTFPFDEELCNFMRTWNQWPKDAVSHWSVVCSWCH